VVRLDRSTQRKIPHGRDDEQRLTASPNCLLRQAGWIINDKRVERIWQREGLKVPHK
jgi:putative transposase